MAFAPDCAYPMLRVSTLSHRKRKTVSSPVLEAMSSVHPVANNRLRVTKDIKRNPDWGIFILCIMRVVFILPYLLKNDCAGG